MTDEEKKAIESIKQEISRVNKINDLTGTYVPINNLEIVLNLIEKQDKRIKELEKTVEKKDKKIKQTLKMLESDIRQCENEITATQDNQNKRNMSGSARRHLSSLSGRINEAKRILNFIKKER